MKKGIAMALSISLVASFISGCSSEGAPITKVHASEDIEKYNNSILEVCNYEVNGGKISDNNKVAKTNLDTLRNAYESNAVNYKVDITDQMQSVVDYMYYGLEMNYVRDKYPNDFDVDIFDEEESEEELERQKELAKESKKYRDLAEIVSTNIKRFSTVRNKDHIKYLDLVYETCELYNSIPENYRQVIYNASDLEYEIEMLGGKLDKNFNIEKQKYLWDIQMKVKAEKARLGMSDSDDEDLYDMSITIETEPYTGPSDEELGLAEPGPGGIYDKVWEEGETWSYEETSTSDESESYEDGEIEETSGTESSIEETSMEEVSTDKTVESTESNTEIAIETSVEYTDDADNQVSEDAKSELVVDTSFREYYDCVEDGGDSSSCFVSMNKVCNKLVSLDDKLSYENDRIYINLEGAPESGEIDLLGGYYISWIIQKNEPTKFSLTDYIYWDTNGFKVRCVNESGRMVTLEGYVSDDVIYINNITDILDKINPARAYVYSRTDEEAYSDDYYEDASYYDETSEVEMSTEDMVEETSEVEESLTE